MWGEEYEDDGEEYEEDIVATGLFFISLLK
jgi:hypothetical protein